MFQGAIAIHTHSPGPARRPFVASTILRRLKAARRPHPTERRILQFVSENKTNKEIADKLFISHRTVETHRSNICAKLELQDSHKLLQFAIEHRSEL